MPAAQWREEQSSLRVALLLGLLLTAPAIVLAERLPIKTYTVADGLAHNHVTRIYRDSRGFLWFCTFDGLSRFDGHRFTSYGREHGLPHADVTDILEDRQGGYWLATYGGGVCRFTPSAISPPHPSRGKISSRFTVHRVGEEPRHNLVNVLCQDNAGRLWAGTDDGLFLLDSTRGQPSFHRIELGLPSHHNVWDEVAALVEDREANLWIGTSQGLVRRLPDGRIVHYTSQPQDQIRSVRALLQDHHGRLWIGHAYGLVVFKPEPAATFAAGTTFTRRTLTTLRGEAFLSDGRLNLPSEPGDARFYTAADGVSHPVLALRQSADGRILIGTREGGLIVPEVGRFRVYTTGHGLSDRTILTLGEDLDGNPWIGTLTGGAIKLVRNGFTAYNGGDGLEPTHIVSVFENQADELCVISNGWLINLFDGTRFRAIRPNVPAQAINPAGRFYQAVLQDHAGEWWVGSRQGLYRFSVGHVEQIARTRPKAVYTKKDGLSSDDAYHLFEDSRRDIWISARGHPILTRWERTSNAFHRYSEANGLPRSNWPQSFCEDRAGNLWIGFYEGGLARYAGGRFKLLTAADGVPAGTILKLYLDRRGRLWLGTDRSGASRIDDPTADRPHFVNYTTAEGLANNVVWCFTEDGEERTYLGTSRGVDQLDPATGRIKHYTTNDGLSYSTVRSAFHDRRGWLWFGTLKGLSRLIPESRRPAAPSPVWISGLRIAGDSHPVSELGTTGVSGLVLKPNQNHINVDFFSIAFGMGEALRYQYRLEGVDQDWSAPSDQRTVHYASMSPGKYRFMVRAINADGLASPVPATVSFAILPPIWQRWWFLVLLAMILASVIYWFHRFRVARLLELERVRTRIATDLHDDVGSSLSQIAILSEVARREVEQGDARATHELSLIARISRESVDAMSDIVWAINPQRDRLSDLTARMRRFASEIFPGCDIEFGFETSLPQQDLRIGADERRQIFLIFKECIHNMVRHSACTRADLEVRTDGGALVMQLRDNGRGFDPSVAPEGHGLTSMQRRAASLGGELHIVSNKGQGTTITLAVPSGQLSLRQA